MPKNNRVSWPIDVASEILTKCHHRCCICPEHRRVSDIHHIDEDPSNSIESNGIGLCKECHSDVHTTSTMRRNITADQLKIYKERWEATCRDLSLNLISRAGECSEFYYVNVHRLDSECRRSLGCEIFKNIPHKPVVRDGCYNSLWSNPRNTLSWVQLAENRSYFECCTRELLSRVTAIDLNLIEVGAVDARQRIGSLVSFSCQFFGHDIPDESELTETSGQVEGPPPTMRRFVRDHEDQTVYETCMMLDPQYLFVSSAFIHFAEQGYWCGLARIIKVRDGIGSNDGIYSREQLVLSPIFIGIPLGYEYVSPMSGDAVDPDKCYRELSLSVAE